jgi:hypothetical protein
MKLPIKFRKLYFLQIPGITLGISASAAPFYDGARTGYDTS